jgi:hypothetical protein
MLGFLDFQVLEGLYDWFLFRIFGSKLAVRYVAYLHTASYSVGQGMYLIVLNGRVYRGLQTHRFDEIIFPGKRAIMCEYAGLEKFSIYFDDCTSCILSETGPVQDTRSTRIFPSIVLSKDPEVLAEFGDGWKVGKDGYVRWNGVVMQYLQDHERTLCHRLTVYMDGSFYL